MLMMKSSLYRLRRLISLRRVADRIDGFRLVTSRALEIGAKAWLSVPGLAPEVRRVAPSIAEILLTHSNVRVRDVATIAHADPDTDLPPLLITLDARSGRRSSRGAVIVVDDLFAAYLEMVLAGDELIAALTVPPRLGRRATCLKHRTRGEQKRFDRHADCLLRWRWLVVQLTQCPSKQDARSISEARGVSNYVITKSKLDLGW